MYFTLSYIIIILDPNLLTSKDSNLNRKQNLNQILQLGTVRARHMQSEDCFFRNLAPFCVLISLILLRTNVYMLTVKLWFRFITDDNCSHKYVLLNTAHIWQAN